METSPNQNQTSRIQAILIRKLCIEHSEIRDDKCHQVLQIL